MAIEQKRENQLTVGWLREQIEGLADDVLVTPDWEDDPPSDSEPAVAIYGFHVRRPADAPPELIVRVGLKYLDEFDSDDETNDAG